MLLRRKTCFMAAVKSVLLQIAALCVTGQFQPGFYHLLKLKLFWLNPLSPRMLFPLTFSLHSSAVLESNELSNRYDFFPFPGFTAPSH